jgi:hypothetical protein
VPAEEARLEWRIRLDDAKVNKVTTAWVKINRLPVGEWHLLPDMTIVAWNLEDEEQFPR